MKPLIPLLLLVLVMSCRKDDSPETRSFYLAVTPWPPDFTTRGLDLAYNFIDKDCDMVSHHFDEGVPWEECLTGDTLPVKLTDNVNERIRRTPSGKKVLLSVAPMQINRTDKAIYLSDVNNDPRSAEWQAKPFSDSTVIRAYENYLEYLIQSLHPDYVNYGVESNLGSRSQQEFDDYKIFLDSVYHHMKAAHPNLPFFISFMVSTDPAFLDKARQLEAYTDYITISAYLYTFAGSPVYGSSSPDLIPRDLLPSYANINAQKPFAVAETGYIAEDLVMTQITKEGNPQWQEDYVNYLFEFCTERHAVFVVWFCAYDYNNAINTFEALGANQDLFGLWTDTGLIDEELRERPALQVWRLWKKKLVVY